MLNEQFMVSQVFPDMYPHGDAGPQLFADAELDELRAYPKIPAHL